MRTLKLQRPHIRGNDVETVQTLLHKYFFCPVINGIFDTQTHIAVKQFQGVYNLPISGIVTQETWNVLLAQAKGESRLPPLTEPLTQIALKYTGVPYIWGAQHPSAGFDALGFLLFCLEEYDDRYLMGYGSETVADLAARCQLEISEKELSSGDLVFYGTKAGEPSHIGIYLGNGMVIGAFGGNRGTVNKQIALKRNACVQVKPLHFREHIKKIARIF